MEYLHVQYRCFLKTVGVLRENVSKGNIHSSEKAQIKHRIPAYYPINVKSSQIVLFNEVHCTNIKKEVFKLSLYENPHNISRP